MLYFLSHFSAEWSVLNLFRYITFRSGGALFTAFFLMLIAAPPFIAFLRKKQGEGQPIRADGPQTHFAKKGTPTMGGVMILGAGVLATLLWANWMNPYVWLLLFVFVGFGLSGFLDDFLKLKYRNAKGVTFRQKIVLQVLLSGVFCLGAMYLNQGATSTTLAFPFLKDVFWNMGWFYVPFAIVVLVGASNAVNLTDGLDGLVSIPAIMATLVFMVIAYVVGRPDYAQYLLLPHLPGTGELVVFCSALVGATLGFLWYNAHPAQIFMGDTGSLALGGVLGALAVVTKHEIVLVIAGGVFVAEALSDIIQVGSYRWRKKRVFLMAPIHHHFEKKGWSETTVVVRFWIVSILLALLALSTLKLR